MTVLNASQAPLPTQFGNFIATVFSDSQGIEHCALSTPHLHNGALVRLHSECATGDIFGSLRCDCRDQLETALQRIHQSENGILIYLRGHEGRGIGLANKIKAYALQDKGFDTAAANLALDLPVDARDYEMAAAILKHFHQTDITLLTNNRAKIEALEKAGITITERQPLWLATNPHNVRYITTKRDVMGHLA